MSSLQIFTDNQHNTLSINNIPVQSGSPTQGNILVYNEMQTNGLFYPAHQSQESLDPQDLQG